MKASSIVKSIFLGTVAIFWILMFIISYLIFSLKPNNESQKPCILAGYASGSIIDYRLEVYADSTFYLSSARNGKNKTWKIRSDTLLLFENGELCAKIVNLKATKFNGEGYQSLSIMKLKKFSPSKIVKYPKNN